MPFLELQNLQKTYPDGTRAVRGIDLAVDEGEFIVLLGPSGCGKTTTLRMIAGLENPTDGQIVLANQNVTHLPPSQRDMGFVFQFYALYPHMSVQKNIAFPLENIGMAASDINATVDRVARALGIEGLLGQYPRQLSGGDQQRVSLARAMVRTPDVYLMDEPLGTLDAEHRLELREFIRRQQLALSTTALYVTHDQEEAMSLGDRLVVMEGGKIRQTGSPSEIYTQPADLFVANFVGSPGMNLISGRIVRDGDGLAFTRQGANVHLPIRRRVSPGRAILGIRPEFIRPADQGLPGKVVLQEYMGSHAYVHVDTPLGELVMHAPDRFATSETIRLRLDEDRVCLFDPETGVGLGGSAKER